MGYYRASTLEDCHKLAPMIRTQDLVELEYTNDLSPLEAITASYYASEECNTMIDNNEKIIGMFGIGRIGDQGKIWMIATPGLNDVSIVKQFLHEKKKWLNKVKNNYSRLFNFVYDENTMTKRWLKWLGFELKHHIPQYGNYKKPFWLFEMEIA